MVKKKRIKRRTKNEALMLEKAKNRLALERLNAVKEALEDE